MTDAPNLRRYHDWLRRVGQITQYSELWVEQPDHPARESLERLSARLSSDFSIDVALVGTLLGDVVHAAGGVEYHAGRVLGALDRTQSKHSATLGGHPQVARQPEVERQYSAIEESLTWDYPNLLIWLRTVEERVDRLSIRFNPGPKLSRFEEALVWLLRRRHPDLVCRPRPVRTRVGLLPAVGEQLLRTELERLLQSYKDRVGDKRSLANYGLRAARMPDPNTPMATLGPDGRLVVPIPDPPAEPVYVFEQFTYEQRRDLDTFALVAVNATDEFMNAILDAFEQASTRAAAARAACAEGPRPSSFGTGRTVGAPAQRTASAESSRTRSRQ